MQLIHVYTRKQALEDGNLVDVSKLASEARLRFPTAVTAAVWAKYVVVPEAVPWQDETGRLWDILWMLRVQISQGRANQRVLFFLLQVCNEEDNPELVTLKAHVGPGDEGEPVITIMLPDED